MPPSSPRLSPERSLGLYLSLLFATGSGCTLLVDSVLSDKGAGAGGASGSGTFTAGSATSVGSGGASTHSAATTGSGGGMSSSAASTSGGGGGVPCSANMTCALAHAMASCVQGQCVIDSCAAGYDDCDMMPADGCETQLKTDPMHCGSCMNPCQAGHSCMGGMCK
jgi:hypothetical protein